MMLYIIKLEFSQKFQINAVFTFIWAKYYDIKNVSILWSKKLKMWKYENENIVTSEVDMAQVKKFKR